jgi:hypothetical protein
MMAGTGILTVVVGLAACGTLGVEGDEVLCMDETINHTIIAGYSDILGNLEDRFDPADIEIAPGASVCWTNYDGRMHTVTPVNGGEFGGEVAFEVFVIDTFPDVGTFSYYCEIHEAEGMSGVIRVVAAQ